MAKTRKNATLSNCNFQIKFEEQNLKSAWPCALILISLPPETSLRIVRVSRKMNINKHSLFVLGIKRKNEFCVPPCFISPHEWWEKQHRIVHGQKAMHGLWSVNMYWQPHILLCVIPLLKWCLETGKSPEIQGSAISTLSLVAGVSKPLQDTKSCPEIARS